MNIQDLHRLGRRAAAQLGEGPGDARLEAQREAVLAAQDAAGAATPRRFFVPALAGAAMTVLLVSLAWLLWPRSSPRPPAPEEGLVLTARATPLVMELSGGNAARLSPDSVGQLAVSTPREVRVVLVHGELTSTIRTPVRWSVQAGPYSIEAAGTEYVVRWKDERLEVQVHTGRVRVRGQDSPRAGWLVEAGERLTIDHGRLLQKGSAVAPAAADPKPDETPTTPPAMTEEKPTTDPAADPPSSPGDLPRSSRGAGDATDGPPPGTPDGPAPVMAAPSPAVPPDMGGDPEAPPPWRAMLQREEYGPAVAWIEKQGLSSFADHAPLQDLQAMANAARYAGRGQTAVVLLVSLRTRFPGTAQAATAAFLMGRVYSEQLKDQRAAVSWFSTYLAEVPSGSLVEEALGRRMDAAQRAGMTSEARKSAATLVERYPASPFKPLAQQILGTDK